LTSFPKIDPVCPHLSSPPPLKAREPNLLLSRGSTLIDVQPYGVELMRTITEQSELAEFLFEVLTESEPLQKVNASFLLRMTGICYSLIHGGLYGERDYMEDIIAFHWERRTLLLCGTKLVVLAQSLAAEGCFEPDRVWSTRRLIELMMAALDNNDLLVEQDQETGDCSVISTQQFSTEHDVTIRVKLEQEPDMALADQSSSSGGL
jgi:hypothetical protein